MSIRAATIIIGLLLIGLVAFIIFNFVSAFFRNEKIINITKEQVFEPTELKVDNGQIVKIKNNDSNHHEIVTNDTNKTLVTVDSGKTSEKLELENDTNYDLVLAEKTDSKTKIIVGSPTQESTNGGSDLSSIPTPTLTSTPSASPTPTATPTVTKTATISAQGKPLPPTGPGDDLKVALILVIGGILALKYSKPLFSF